MKTKMMDQAHPGSRQRALITGLYQFSLLLGGLVPRCAKKLGARYLKFASGVISGLQRSFVRDSLVVRTSLGLIQPLNKRYFHTDARSKRQVGQFSSGSNSLGAVPQNIDLNVAYEGNGSGIGQDMGTSSSLHPFQPSGSGSSSDGQRLSDKRKAPEEISGEVPGRNLSSTRLEIHPSSLTGNAESIHREVRLRTSSTNQQDPVPASISLFGTSLGPHVQSSNQSSVVSLLNRSTGLSLGPVAGVANTTSQVQPFLHVPSTSQTMQPALWNRISSSSSGSASIFPAIIANGSNVLQAEQNPRYIPRDTSRQSVSVSGYGRGNLEYNSTNLRNFPSNITFSSQIGSRSGVQLTAPPGFPQRNIVEGAQNGLTSGVQQSTAHPRFLSQSIAEGYERRSSEYVDHSMSRSVTTVRNVLASSAGDPTAVLSLFGQGVLMTRAERDNSVAPPISSQIQLQVATERRAIIVSEDGMIIDGSGFDEEPEEEDDMLEDMRLDVDNMSYEELLALEEQIGNVSTGLDEEAIVAGMRRHRYQSLRSGSSVEDPCCICQDEYLDGQELGKLNCGHDFHFDCIKQWLLQKNSCPFCKMTALTVGERNR
ncbi:hypothetical protein F0562_006598 [Nyssa sinensis]|uniref:RING-type E3 ubiquitin transferase n=1 Tax=Nyssa sinensis TaxID=561372 RepID=A0A5J5AKX0_9ASTE|nr:hypothetical protein F0562_006598 [Nyssa sinensis]